VRRGGEGGEGWAEGARKAQEWSQRERVEGCGGNIGLIIDRRKQTYTPKTSHLRMPGSQPIPVANPSTGAIAHATREREIYET